MGTCLRGMDYHTSDERVCLSLMLGNCPDFRTRIKAKHFHLNMSAVPKNDGAKIVIILQIDRHRCTAAGIYALRQLQMGRCAELDIRARLRAPLLPGAKPHGLCLLWRAPLLPKIRDFQHFYRPMGTIFLEKLPFSGKVPAVCWVPTP